MQKNIFFKRNTYYFISKKLYFIVIILFILQYKHIYSKGYIDQEKMSCKELFSLVIDAPFKLQKIVKNQLYKNIRAYQQRSILTNPITLPENSFLFNQDKHLGMGIYFLSQPEIKFGNSSQITDIVNFNDFLGKDIFDELLSLTEFGAINFPVIGDLFNYVSISSYIIPLILHGSYFINDTFCMYIQLPFNYQANFPSVPEQVATKFDVEFAQLEPRSIDDGNDPYAYQKKNICHDGIRKKVVADSFGIAQSVLGARWYFNDELLCLEARAFFPGMTFKRGLIGGDFTAANKTKTAFSMTSFISDVLNDNVVNAKEEFGTLFNSMLSRIIASTYDTSNQYDPAAISSTVSGLVPLHQNIFLSLYGSYLYNFASKKTMYGYVPIQYASLAYIDDNNLSELQACQALRSLDEEAVHRIFLYGAEGGLQRGPEIQGIIGLKTDVNDIAIHIGCDLWHRMAGDSWINNQRIASSLVFHQPTSASMINGFFKVDIFTDYSIGTFAFSFSGQGSFIAKNIGMMFGLGLDCSFIF